MYCSHLYIITYFIVLLTLFHNAFFCCYVKYFYDEKKKNLIKWNENKIIVTAVWVYHKMPWLHITKLWTRIKYTSMTIEENNVYKFKKTYRLNLCLKVKRLLNHLFGLLDSSPLCIWRRAHIHPRFAKIHHINIQLCVLYFQISIVCRDLYLYLMQHTHIPKHQHKLNKIKKY